MHRYLLLITLSLLLVGCDINEQHPEILLAQRQAAAALVKQKDAEAAVVKERELAEQDKSSLRFLAFGLSIAALLAFFVGVAIVSSSKKDAAGPSRHG